MTRVLVVDDDSSNRLTLAALVEEEGLQVQTADSLQAARSTLGQNDARFDLALVDLHLSDGLGTELIDELHASGARVIIMSGTAELGDAVTRAEGAIMKGESFDDLFGLMTRVLAREPHSH